jgi:hypothetical protein
MSSTREVPIKPLNTTGPSAIPKAVSQRLLELVANFRLLAQHAAETGQLPTSLDIENLYSIQNRIESHESITEQEFSTLVRSYQTLERRLGPVTADTLRATERTAEPDGTNKPSDAEAHVSRLWRRIYWSIGLILGFHLVHAAVEVYAPVELERLLTLSALTGPVAFFRELLAFIGVVTTYLIPFLYGALGADACLLREATRQLHSRQFDPRRIPESRSRFLLGTLSGGVVVLFVTQVLAGSVSGIAPVFMPLLAAPGFLVGYSSDVLFDMIERVIRAILPPRGRSIAEARPGGWDVDEMLTFYRRRLDAATDPKDKEVLRGVVEDFESRLRDRV